MTEVIMPLLSLKVSIEVGETVTRKLLGSLSQIIADETKKPVQYVMVTLEKADMALGRDVSPSAFADVRGIGGFNKQVNTAITKRVCDLLHTETGIAPARVYLTFTDVPASNWGTDSSVFG
jgi:phenylpyruvate tautomerase PptA (4-oxalocrotonate tautomerase family)